MKLKTYITSLLLLVISSAYSQVGIGTTSPNASSMLDITSANSGLLIPRVPLTGVSDTSTIPSPITSLLVYNSGFAPNGFYYFNGTIWVQLAVGTNTDWSLTGNTGTNIATNFFGTTDNKDIIFKRNNIRAGYIGDPYYDPTTFDHNNGNTSFGANSLVNPTVNVGTQTGIRNTAVGVNSMPALTSGRLNNAFGDFALFSISSGIQNTAIGSGALFTNSTANNNVAIGRNALSNSNANNNTAVGTSTLLQNSSGTGNTAVGREALRGTTTPSPLGTPSTGNNNTSVGYQSSFLNISGANNVTLGMQSFSANTTGSGNVAIGYQSGALETGSNKLYIENSNADANNALIYGEFDNNIVRVNGALGISVTPSGVNKLEVNGKTKTTDFQMTNGANSNYVLQSDASGNAAWVNASTLTITETDPQVSSATSNIVPKWNGTTLVDGILTDDGTNVGVGVTPSAGNKLEVNGKTKTTNFQMTNGATANYVLQSDATGNASWVNASTLTITETDPQVSSTTSNTVPKWNGTTLVDGVMTDDGTNVGVGVTPSAGNKLEVNGKTKTTDFQMTNGGAANYVLQSDASGNGSWALPNNSLSIVRATMSGGTDQALTNGGWQKVTFNNAVFDTNTEFNTSSNRFVATKAGYYEINAGYHIKSTTSTNQFSIGVRINGGFYQETGGFHFGSGIVSRNINCIVNLAVNDYVEIYVENTLTGALIDGYSGKTFFEVKQIR